MTHFTSGYIRHQTSICYHDLKNCMHMTWRHQMETSSALLAICAGNSPVRGEFPAQRPVTWKFDVFFDLRPNKRLSKQWWGWWFETPSIPLWRHCNDLPCLPAYIGSLSVNCVWEVKHKHIWTPSTWQVKILTTDGIIFLLERASV